MSQISLIRKSVFRVTQIEFAAIAGVPQSVISRWETGELHPRLPALERIRDEAQRRGLSWDDSWFFEIADRGDAA